MDCREQRVFWSLVRWFANTFHPWLRQTWKLLANHSNRDQTISLFTEIHISFYMTDFPLQTLALERILLISRGVHLLHLKGKYHVCEIKTLVKCYLNLEVIVGVIFFHTRCHFIRCKNSPVNVSRHRVIFGAPIYLWWMTIAINL